MLRLYKKIASLSFEKGLDSSDSLESGQKKQVLLESIGLFFILLTVVVLVYTSMDSSAF